MAGRYGHRGGRGGRGGRSTPNTSTKETKKKKSIEDYFFYVGSSKQASDFETTSEFLVNYVKKTFDRGNDVAEAPRTLTPEDTELWKPALQFSTATEDTKSKQENRQHELEYKANLDEFMRRKRSYDDNLFKAYALIWERCAKAMQNKIMARSNFEAAEIYNDPIKLLNAVKEHALNYQETRYEMSIISDAFRALFNLQQKESESLQDYTRRFKTAREILESHLGGQIVLTKFARTMPKYDQNNAEANTECIENASEQLFAFLYLKNADQDKYGSLLKGLNSQKSLGHDQYPRMVTEANNVLSNHRFDPTKPKAKPPGSSNLKYKSKQGEKGKEDDELPTLSFAQMEGKCYCCAKPGHRSPDCRQKDKIPKDEWVINKSQSHAAANATAGGDAKGTILSAAASTTSRQHHGGTNEEAGISLGVGRSALLLCPIHESTRFDTARQ
jgi:hypothetical protein